MHPTVVQIVSSCPSDLKPCTACGSTTCILNEALRKLPETVPARVVKAVASQKTR